MAMTSKPVRLHAHRIVFLTNSCQGIKFIDQVLHLQRIVKLPTAPFVSNGQIGTVAPAKKPARQQPKGLKMRYHPIGFDGTDDNNAHLSEERGNGADSDKEIEDAPAFRQPEMLQGDDASDQDMTDLLPPPREANRQPRRGSKDSLKRKRKHDHGRVKNSNKRLYQFLNAIEVCLLISSR